MRDNELLRFHLKRCFYKEKASENYIFEKYHSYVESFCEYYTSDYEELITLINECFCLAFKNIPFDGRHKIPDEASFCNWLRKWIICGIVDHSRKNFKHQRLLHFKHVPLSDHSVLWENFFQKFYTTRGLKSTEAITCVVDSLSPSSRIILNLIVLEKFTDTDVADCLGIPNDTASSNISKLFEQINLSVPLYKKNTTAINYGHLQKCFIEDTSYQYHKNP